MEEKKKHVYLSDIFAVIISFALSGVTIFSAFKSIIFLPLASFYFFIGSLRLFILIVEVVLVRRKDPVEVKFRKEKIVSRLAGVIIILFNSLFLSALVILVNRAPSTLYSKFQWLAYGYAAYGFYKFVSAFIHLYKARKSYSPYRETICYLSFIAAMMTILTLEVTLLALFSTYEEHVNNLIEMLTALGIALVIYLFAFLMIKSRKIPTPKE